MKAERIEIFEGGVWGTGTAMAQAQFGAVSLVLFLELDPSRINVMVIGSDADAKQRLMDRWAFYANGHHLDLMEPILNQLQDFVDWYAETF